MPAMSGKCGRLSWPTALTTALATSVSSVPSGSRTTTVHVAVGRRPTWPSAPRCRTGCGRARRSRRAQSRKYSSSTSWVGEVERPVVALRERVAVVVVRVVDPAARIRVLEPGAADVGVLLDDHVVDAGLREPVRGEEARHARADDDDAEVGVGGEVGLAPLRAAPVVAAERELLLEQRQVVAHVGAADDVLHDAQRGRRATGGGGDSHAVVAEADRARRARARARWPAASARHPALREREQVRVGAQVVAQQREVAGDVRERGQQRRDLGLGEVRARISSSVAVIGATSLITCR